MKVAQNDETNPNTQLIRRPRVPSIANPQPSPSGSSVQKCETPGILYRMFSHFAGITNCVRAHLTPLVVMSCIVMHMFALYLLFLPPLLSLDLETDAVAAAPIDCGVDDPSFLEQPGKSPLDHQISPIPFLYCLH